MKVDKAAKALLERKTCYTCWRTATLDDDIKEKKCRKGAIITDFPEEYTCEEWDGYLEKLERYKKILRNK